MSDDFLKPSHKGVQRLTQQFLDEAGPERMAQHVLGMLQESGIMTLRDIANALRCSDQELLAVIHYLDEQTLLTHYDIVDGEPEEIV
jgi:hypothetical protein